MDPIVPLRALQRSPRARYDEPRGGKPVADIAETIGQVIARNAADPAIRDRPFIFFEDQVVSHRAFELQSRRHAALFERWRGAPGTPFHVGVLMENTSAFMYCLGGAALGGATIVGLHPGRRGAALVDDVRKMDCRVVITEPALLPGVLGQPALADLPIVVVGAPTLDADARHAGVARLDDLLAEVPAEPVLATAVHGDTPFMIIFTSGSTGAPKGILCTHRMILTFSGRAAARLRLTSDDIAYVAMPLCHSNAIFLSVHAMLQVGGAVALRRRFSARGFIEDIRRYRCTTFNYVGKPLAYVLATEPRPTDREHRLRALIGNGASAKQQADFIARFGVDEIVELYAATENGIPGVLRGKTDPPGSVGVPSDVVRILDERGGECPPARFDATGRMVNADAAIGEIVNASGPGLFVGYYANPAATAERLRDGTYHSGDLGYVRIHDTPEGPKRFLYFVGRTSDWIRKDGENLLPEVIEDIVTRHPGVFLCSAYGVPCAEGDEHVMLAIVLAPGHTFASLDLFGFCAAQPDMMTTWIPDYVRVLAELPQTGTLKILRRTLKTDGFDLERVADPVYWRERGEAAFKPFTRADLARLEARFADAGRALRRQT